MPVTANATPTAPANTTDSAKTDWETEVDEMMLTTFDAFATPVTLEGTETRAIVRTRYVHEHESTITGLRKIARFLAAENPELRRGMELTIDTKKFRLDAQTESPNDRASIWILRSDTAQ